MLAQTGRKWALFQRIFPLPLLEKNPTVCYDSKGFRRKSDIFPKKREVFPNFAGKGGVLMEEHTPIRAQMFGSFELSVDDVRSGGDSRAKKVWLLLAYLIYRRGQNVQAEDYANLLWEGDESGADPANALKTLLHRVRAALDRLWPGAGHQLILRQGSSYCWNPDYPVTLDVEEFDRLRAQGDAAGDEEEQLRCYLAALELYRGDFLARFSSNLWVVPIATHYHQIYLRLADQTLTLLRQQGRYSEMETLARTALARDAYSEELSYHLMDVLLLQKRRQEATTVYEDLAQLLMDDFGVMPSDRIRELYREVLSELNDHSLPIDAILDQLREPEGARGAMICHYDIFRSIYHAVARSLIRSGDVVHLVLISVHHRDGDKALSKRSLETAVKNLQEVMRGSLRRGDVVSRCSVSQVVVMLPQANFENSHMISQRIHRAFTSQYPHSPAELRFSVHALEPN